MREVKAITHLLKENNAPFGAQKANKLLLAIGVLEEAERESNTSPGAMRKFKKVSDAGEAYGENEWNDYGDAQPRFFSDTFPELLGKLIEAEKAAGNK